MLACALHSLVVGQLSAQIIDYSITGTFDSSVSTTLVSAPNATFDIQFSLTPWPALQCSCLVARLSFTTHCSALAVPGTRGRGFES